MHQSSIDNMRSFVDRYLEARREEPLSILDLGSLDINGSYRPLFECDKWNYQGADMSSGKNVDIVLRNPYRWQELKSSSFDVLISGQTFEHIEYFWVTMLEIERILRQSGICCLIAPSGGYAHRYPVDCWRFYSDGFASLARFAGMELLEVFTEWNPKKEYTDESSQWKDTVMVCRKPRMSVLKTWCRMMRRWMLYHMLR